MHQQLESAFAEAKGPKAQLLKWATNTSIDHYNQLLAGGSGNGLQYRMAEKLLLRKIWEKLGLDRYVLLSWVRSVMKQINPNPTFIKIVFYIVYYYIIIS